MNKLLPQIVLRKIMEDTFEELVEDGVDSKV